MRRRRWVLGVLVGVVAVVTGGIVGVMLQPSGALPPARFMSSGPLFNSVAELTANSDLVLVGTVQSSEVGAVLEAEDPEFPTREVHTVLDLDAALKGGAAEEPLTVATLELAYAPAPDGPVPDWRQEGTRVLAFLTESNEGSPFLYPTSYPQSFYIIEGEALLAAYQESDEGLLSERIEEMSLSQLIAAVERP